MTDKEDIKVPAKEEKVSEIRGWSKNVQVNLDDYEEEEEEIEEPTIIPPKQ